MKEHVGVLVHPLKELGGSFRITVHDPPAAVKVRETPNGHLVREHGFDNILLKLDSALRFKC